VKRIKNEQNNNICHDFFTCSFAIIINFIIKFSIWYSKEN